MTYLKQAADCVPSSWWPDEGWKGFAHLGTQCECHPGLAQESPSLLRAQLSPVGGRILPHWPNGPKHTGQQQRAGWAGWKEKPPTGGVGLSPWEVPLCRKRASGAQLQPWCISVSTCCLQVCPPLPPPTSRTLLSLSRDPGVEERSPRTESDTAALLPARPGL